MFNLAKITKIILLLVIISSLSSTFIYSGEPPPPPPPSCPIKSAGCYKIGNGLVGFGALLQNEFDYYLPANKCIYDGSCSCQGVPSDINEQRNSEESKEACNCIAGTAWDVRGKCCGNDIDDCGKIVTGILCIIDANGQSANWAPSAQNLGDIRYVGCANAEYLSDGNTWIKCDGSFWRKTVGDGEYMCIGKGRGSIAECCGDGTCQSKVDGKRLSTGQSVNPSSNKVTVTSGTGGSKAFTSSGSWTVPAGVTSVKVTVVGGGGGGGGGGGWQGISPAPPTHGGDGGKGGRGGADINRVVNVNSGQTYTITVGSGGAGGAGCTPSGPDDGHCVTVDGSAGNSGGKSSFGVMVAASGGGGGGGGKHGSLSTGNGQNGNDGSAGTPSGTVGNYGIGGAKGIGGYQFSEGNGNFWGTAGGNGAAGYVKIEWAVTNSTCGNGICEPGEAGTSGKAGTCPQDCGPAPNITYYCRADKKFASNLDTPNSQISDNKLNDINKKTCEKAGFKWTGTKCCSEDDDPNEYYNDPDDIGGCWNKKPVLSISFVNGTDNSVINYHGEFHGCAIGKGNTAIGYVSDESDRQFSIFTYVAVLTGQVISTPITGGSQAFTSSGSWTVPAGVTSVKVTVVGGGGGGGGGGSGSLPNGPVLGYYTGGDGGKGGRGGADINRVVSVNSGQTYTITVGSGGAGGAGCTPSGPDDGHCVTVDGSAGNSGGKSSFGVMVTASGGGGGGGGKHAEPLSRLNGANGNDGSAGTPNGVLNNYGIGGVKGIGGYQFLEGNGNFWGTAGGNGAAGYVKIEWTVASTCGNGICEPGEATTCPADCQRAVTTSSDLRGVVGQYFNAVFTATGGTLPYSWQVSSGSLPPGLSLQQRIPTILLCDIRERAPACVQVSIAGTPTQAGTYQFTLTATDRNGISSSAVFVIVISPTSARCGNGICEPGEATNCPPCTTQPCPQAPCVPGTCPQDCQNQPITITVLSPNGGERWKKGTTNNILWQSSGVNQVNIWLVDHRFGANCPPILLNMGQQFPPNRCPLMYLIAQNIPASSGKYSWTISNLIPTGDNYKILIKSTTPTNNQINSNYGLLQIIDTHTGGPLITNHEYCFNDPGKNYYCSYIGKWLPTDGADKTHLSLAPIPNPKQQGECCAKDECWDGDKCVANQRENPLAQPIGDNFRCIDGQWTQSDLKFTPDDSASGYCPKNPQCLVNVFGKNESSQCIDSGQYVEDNYCENGKWSSRTKLLALKLLSIKSGDFTLFCDDRKNSLNNLQYLTESGEIVANVLTKMQTNNFCVLKTGGRVIAATSINKNLEDVPANSLNILGITSCTDALIDDGQYHSCDATNKVWFNKGLKSFIYSSTPITIPADQNILASFDEFIGAPIKNIIDSIKRLITNPPFDESYVKGFRKFNKLYMNQKASKSIKGFIEGRNFKNAVIQYTGFDADLCKFVEQFNQAKKDLSSGVSCKNEGSNNYVLAQGSPLSNINPEMIWPDLTSKLRLK